MFRGGIFAMPKRKRPVARRTQAGPPAELRPALMRRKKAELVEFLIELAERDREVLRHLTGRFNVATTPDELIGATRQAIEDATDFDERDVDRDFSYDYEAYDAVKRNLSRLVQSGLLRPAMELALELMKRGSYQVEMSDEGVMSDDIEDCLSVVIKALKKCDLPGDEVSAWCFAMIQNDRVGFIAEEALRSLQSRVKADTGS